MCLSVQVRAGGLGLKLTGAVRPWAQRVCRARTNRDSKRGHVVGARGTLEGQTEVTESSGLNRSDKVSIR